MSRYVAYGMYTEPHPGLLVVEAGDGRPAHVVAFDYEVADLRPVAAFWARLYGLPIDDRRVWQDAA